MHHSLEHHGHKGRGLTSRTHTPMLAIFGFSRPDQWLVPVELGGHAGHAKYARFSASDLCAKDWGMSIKSWMQSPPAVAGDATTMALMNHRRTAPEPGRTPSRARGAGETMAVPGLVGLVVPTPQALPASRQQLLASMAQAALNEALPPQGLLVFARGSLAALDASSLRQLAAERIGVVEAQSDDLQTCLRQRLHTFQQDSLSAQKRLAAFAATRPRAA